VNTGYLPQIAHVVVWTDWSYPVLDFNVFLTGFDVQPLSMYDIIVNGQIAPRPSGATGGTTSDGDAVLSPIGAFSALNTANANIPSLASCGTLPGAIPEFVRAAVQSMLVTGTAAGICTNAGSPSASHPTSTSAVGYVTVDVVAVCSQNMPDASTYVKSEILFDNVLTGDYEILNKAAGSNYAGGNPLVHIRAIPEGGPAGTPLAGQQTNLPYTFYQRYEDTVNFAGGLTNYDRRQPLPSTFAARWIQGGPSAFNTSYRIWSEGQTGGLGIATGCAASTAAAANNAIRNSALAVTAIVRFDEHENPTVPAGIPVSFPLPPPGSALFPETSTSSTASGNFPSLSSPAGDVGGWMYLNLAGPVCPIAVCHANLALHPNWPNGGARASQNWVIVSMTSATGGASANGLFGVDFDATWLGNGCNPPDAAPLNQVPSGIGPVGGILVCPQGNPGCTPGVGKYTGTNVTP